MYLRRFARAGQALVLCVTAVCGFSLPALAADVRLPVLALSGPPAAVSFPLVVMAQSGALADVAQQVKFTLWRDPDQLRVLALEGRPAVMAMPTNVAANLYNRGTRLKLLNVSAWGILWVVSRSADVKTLADIKGEEIAMPFRADMPDIVFATLAERQGLNPRKDFALRYVATPMDAMQLLIARRVDHALLAEPAVSMALRKTQSFPLSVVAPELYRGIDMQQEWARVLQREARVPQAGIVAVGDLAEQPELMQRIHLAYDDAMQWCQAHAQQCAEIVAQHIDLLTPEAVVDAIRASPLQAVAAPKARAELDYFLSMLFQRNASLVGGKMPDDAFYASTE